MQHRFIIYEPTILIGMDMAETVLSHDPSAEVTLCHDRAEAIAALNACDARTTAILHLARSEGDLFDLAKQRGLRVVLLDQQEIAQREGVPWLSMPFDPDILRRLVFSAL